MDREIKETIKEEIKDEIRHGRRWGYHRHGGGNAVYGLGFIGALVYYLGQAASFSAGLLGILKAIVWPAFLVYDVFRFLGR